MHGLDCAQITTVTVTWWHGSPSQQPNYEENSVVRLLLALMNMPYHGEKQVSLSLLVLRERLVLWMWKHGWVSRPL
jgi:hypothetical protein